MNYWAQRRNPRLLALRDFHLQIAPLFPHPVSIPFDVLIIARRHTRSFRVNVRKFRGAHTHMYTTAVTYFERLLATCHVE